MCGGIWEIQGKRGVFRNIWGVLSDRSYFEELVIHKMNLFKLILKKYNGAGK